jgi:hypothetical protein
MQLAVLDCVKRSTEGELTMAMEKKTIVSKKPAPSTKNNSAKKVDTTKLVNNKVVAARMITAKRIGD